MLGNKRAAPLGTKRDIHTPASKHTHTHINNESTGPDPDSNFLHFEEIGLI